jgi:hypothetical protein
MSPAPAREVRMVDIPAQKVRSGKCGRTGFIGVIRRFGLPMLLSKLRSRKSLVKLLEIDV